MTDARLPEKYLMDRRIIRLSATDFRGYVMATLWSVSNRTDGAIHSDDLVLIPTFAGTTIATLVAAGLWNVNADGWTIADYENTQTSRHDLEVLENARRADREKKRRQRADTKGSRPTFAPTPGDDPGDVSRGTTQDRTGQDRQGQAEYLEPVEHNNAEHQPVPPEPVVNQQTGEVTGSDPVPARWESYVEDGKRKRRKVAA
ncbi:hypothetical protein [Cryobacterium arcticum]|uniref:Uncharacterized protein n=1 Tax=Cryobacterium arcticum TaxID=670052 RepID=A0A318A0T0_9MICO|nr:hypothetical protein [Cryobacterium arcticum]PXA71872.1 hypothetical protein CTB96_02825 [Cryobacterium arcticum]